MTIQNFSQCHCSGQSQNVIKRELFPTFHEHMPKRRASDQLTGGTHDVNPQWLKLHAAVDQGTSADGTNLNAQVGAQVPVIRVPQTASRATVVELLKVRWNNTFSFDTTSYEPMVLIQAISVADCKAFLLTAPISAGALQTVQSSDVVVSGTNVAWHGKRTNFYQFEIGVPNNVINTSVGTTQTYPFEQDLTDESGHGVLVASDNLYLFVMGNESEGVFGNGTTVDPLLQGVDCTCEVLYRFKDVSLTEYIGIVQSQQTPLA